MTWDLFNQVIAWLALGIIGYFSLGGVVLGLLLLRWALLERGFRQLYPQLRWKVMPTLWATWPVALAVVLNSMRLKWKVQRLMRLQERRYGKR